jgi:hypothetical protein
VNQHHTEHQHHPLCAHPKLNYVMSHICYLILQ